MLKVSTQVTQEQHWVTLIKEGNTQALGLLYDKYSPILMGIISRIVENKELAEEILKITFVKALNQIDSYDSSKTSLFTWLIIIARKSALDAIKQEQLNQQTKTQKVANAVNKENKNNKHTDLFFPELYQKEAFELIYYYGLNYKEAASELKISEDELKSNVRMAIKHLKGIKGK